MGGDVQETVKNLDKYLIINTDKSYPRILTVSVFTL